jgi:hypothetical protein
LLGRDVHVGRGNADRALARRTCAVIVGQAIAGERSPAL